MVEDRGLFTYINKKLLYLVRIDTLSYYSSNKQRQVVLIPSPEVVIGLSLTLSMSS